MAEQLNLSALEQPAGLNLDALKVPDPSGLNLDALKPQEAGLNLDALKQPAGLNLDALQVISPGEGPTKTESAVLGVVNSVAFGLLDEAAGLTSAVLAGGDYIKARDAVRARFDAAAKANPKTYLTGEIMGGIATAFVPGFGWANAGVKGAMAGSTLYGIGEAKTISDIPAEAAKAAAFTGAVAGAFKVLGSLAVKATTKAQIGGAAAEAARSGRPYTEAQIKALATIQDEVSDTIHGSTLQIYEKAKSVVPDATEDLPGDFLRFSLNVAPGEKLTKTDLDKFQQVWETALPAKRQQRWDQFVFAQSQKEAVSEYTEKYARELVNLKDPLEREWIGYAKDPMFRFGEYDKLLGTNIEPVFNQFTEASHRISQESAPYLKRMADLQTRAKSAFGKDKSLIKKALETPDEVNLTFAQQEVVDSWKAWFDDVRNTMIENGYEPKRIANYFPQQRVSVDVAYRRLTKEWDSIRGAYSPEAEEFGQFTEAITDILGTQPTSRADVDKALKGMLTAAGAKQRKGFEAAALFRRDGAVPEMLREVDVEKAAIRYLNSNLKAIYLEDAFRNMNTQIATLRGLGMDKGAEVLETYMQRLSGIPSNFMAYVESASAKWKANFGRVMDDPGSSVMKRYAATVGHAAPDLLSWATAQAYPNLLGWNLAGPIRNMSATLFMTAPELRGSYGYKALSRGTAKSIAAYMGGERPEKLMKTLGLVGDMFHGEGVRRSVEEGVYSIPGVGKAMAGIDAFSEFGMKIYGKSDIVMRWMTWHIGQEVAKDLAAGKAGPQRFYNSLSKGMKAEYKYLMSRGQDQAAADLISRWLVRKTQFNYGKAGLSQFGQDYGRLASMFTKWPMMILGDMTDLAKYEKGLDKVRQPMLKYIAPLALLSAMDKATEDAQWKDSPVAKLLLAKNLTSFAPTSAVTDLSIPPLVQVGADVMKSVSLAKDREIEEAAKVLGDALYPYAPGLGGLKKIKDQIDKARGE
jgi:hypothetical protein